MLVVIEGPDGSGKSTLVRKIRDFSLPQQFWCMSSARRYHDIKDVASFMSWLHDRPVETTRLLFDRFPIISEWVYGPILRKSYFDIPLERYAFQTPQSAAHHIAAAFMSLDSTPVIVHCRPPFATLAERVRGEEQMDGVVEHLQELYDRYDLIMGALKEDIMVYELDPYDSVRLGKFEQFLQGLFRSNP